MCFLYKHRYLTIKKITFSPSIIPNINKRRGINKNRSMIKQIHQIKSKIKPKSMIKQNQRIHNSYAYILRERAGWFDRWSATDYVLIYLIAAGDPPLLLFLKSATFLYLYHTHSPTTNVPWS